MIKNSSEEIIKCPLIDQSENKKSLNKIKARNILISTIKFRGLTRIEIKFKTENNFRYVCK